MNEKVSIIYVFIICFVLCYDFDILIIGEICDVEIVKIVVCVVLIGYLVLSMVYVGDVYGVLLRLFEFGISLEELV